MSEMDEALRLADILAGEAPGNREITRDRILIRFLLATLSTQLGDSDAAARHLSAARTTLDELVKAGRFPLALYVDWMGLPTLDAAIGDQAADAGDSSTSREWREKALKRIKERLEKSVSKQ